MIHIYKKLISYGKEKQFYLFLSMIFALLSTIIQIIAFYYLFEVFKQVLVTHEFHETLRDALLIAGLLCGGGIIYFVSLVCSHLFAFRIETNMRKLGIEALSRTSFKFCDTHSSGYIRKLIDDNAAQTHMAVAHLIPDNIGAISMPICLLILGFYSDIVVGIILLILIIISFILIHFMMGDQQFLKKYQASLEQLSAQSVEYVRCMSVVKIFGVDIRHFKKLNKSIVSYAKFAYEYSMSCEKPYVLFQTLFFGIGLLIIPFVLMFKGNGESIVSIIMILILSGLLFVYMMKVMYLSMYIFKAKDALLKLEKLYADMQTDSIEFGSVKTFKNYDIEFENVDFGYMDNKLILDHFNLKLEENKSYAFVGASGSGKSTIAKLISGFYKVNSGTIKIGQKPMSIYSHEALIHDIAFVFQDAKLFKTSIFNNVAYANKKATQDDIYKAMKLAGVDKIYKQFKDQEHTMIGHQGVYLSGGEIQRIAIARAILKDAHIVIFDEASGAIDADNEHELQKAFSHLMKNKTVIIIAHRLSTIQNVDEILVLDQGKVIERGNHKELMKQDKVYASLQKMYKQANNWRMNDEKSI